MLAHVRECGEALAMLADLANELHRPVLTCEEMATKRRNRQEAKMWGPGLLALAEGPIEEF